MPYRNWRAGGGRTIRICPKDRAAPELEAAALIGARPVFTIEPGYPSLLAQLDAPPPAVYVKGDERILSRPAVAIVGSRQASAAGLTLARQFAAQLGHRGLVTVSGLARGVDAAVHEASLESGTVAVLARGIDFVYPPEKPGYRLPSPNAAVWSRRCSRASSRAPRTFRAVTA
jgi:DNA processing protein